MRSLVAIMVRNRIVFFFNGMQYCPRIVLHGIVPYPFELNALWNSVWYDKQRFNSEKRVLCKNFTRRDPRDCKTAKNLITVANDFIVFYTQS